VLEAVEERREVMAPRVRGADAPKVVEAGDAMEDGRSRGFACDGSSMLYKR
jgi:hypothetical protein